MCHYYIGATRLTNVSQLEPMATLSQVRSLAHLLQVELYDQQAITRIWVQLKNTCTRNSQNCTRLCLVQLLDCYSGVQLFFNALQCVQLPILILTIFNTGNAHWLTAPCPISSTSCFSVTFQLIATITVISTCVLENTCIKGTSHITILWITEIDTKNCIVIWHLHIAKQFLELTWRTSHSTTNKYPYHICTIKSTAILGGVP